MNPYHVRSATIVLSLVVALACFCHFVKPPERYDNTHPWTPSGKELDDRYRIPIHDSRNTFAHYPRWSGGIVNQLLTVAADKSFTVTRYNRVQATGHIACIQDAKSDSGPGSVARFRVLYVTRFGEPATADEVWLCTYTPRPRLSGTGLNLWTPITPD